MNYAITRLVNEAFKYGSYSDYNDAMGVLECVKQEFYRRMVVPYEEGKLRDNGEVYPTQHATSP